MMEFMKCASSRAPAPCDTRPALTPGAGNSRGLKRGAMTVCRCRAGRRGRWGAPAPPQHPVHPLASLTPAACSPRDGPLSPLGRQHGGDAFVDRGGGLAADMERMRHQRHAAGAGGAAAAAWASEFGAAGGLAAPPPAGVRALPAPPLRRVG